MLYTYIYYLKPAIYLLLKGAINIQVLANARILAVGEPLWSEN